MPKRSEYRGLIRIGWVMRKRPRAFESKKLSKLVHEVSKSIENDSAALP